MHNTLFYVETLNKGKPQEHIFHYVNGSTERKEYYQSLKLRYYPKLGFKAISIELCRRSHARSCVSLLLFISFYTEAQRYVLHNTLSLP